MAIWFMRFSACICLLAIALVVTLFGLDWYREAANDSAFAAAQQHVHMLGGTLKFDEVQEDYIILLTGPNVGDAQIEQLIVVLRPLSTYAPSPEVPQTFAFNLSGTQVGDQGVQAIATLPVTWLNLNGTRITDQGLRHLRDQKRLSLVTIEGTQVTRPAIDEMQAVLPQLWIPLLDPHRSRR